MAKGGKSDPAHASANASSAASDGGRSRSDRAEHNKSSGRHPTNPTQACSSSGAHGGCGNILFTTIAKEFNNKRNAWYDEAMKHNNVVYL